MPWQHVRLYLEGLETEFHADPEESGEVQETDDIASLGITPMALK